MPEYYCYDVVASLQEAGINLMFYTDDPNYHDDGKTLNEIQRRGQFRPSDAVLRVNYFGMRSYRSSQNLSVAAIVEDHTHDLIGDWALRSEADWCIASLRKTLPIPEGGMLWSPVGHRLPVKPEHSEENERIAAIRWDAMRLKMRYLVGDAMEKVTFRAGYVNTEEYFDRALISALDSGSQEYLAQFDIRDWYNKKKTNWELLCGIKKEGVHVIRPESVRCYPFSLILLFDSSDERDRVRKELIAHQVYPAVLWNVPSPADGEVFNFSRAMLSIHCDGRYTAEDIQQMKSIIESIL